LDDTLEECDDVECGMRIKRDIADGETADLFNGFIR
jgi:hypothetical protein